MFEFLLFVKLTESIRQRAKKYENMKGVWCPFVVCRRLHVKPENGVSAEVSLWANVKIYNCISSDTFQDGKDVQYILWKTLQSSNLSCVFIQAE